MYLYFISFKEISGSGDNRFCNLCGKYQRKAYVTGSSENDQENHPEDEEHLQDESTTNAKTGDESKATMWITILIFSMLVFGCGVKYKKGNK